MPTVKITSRLPSEASVVPVAVREALPLAPEPIAQWGHGSDLCVALCALYDKPCEVTIGGFSFVDSFLHVGIERFEQATGLATELAATLERSRFRGRGRVVSSPRRVDEDPAFGAALKHLILAQNILAELVIERPIAWTRDVNRCREGLPNAIALVRGGDLQASAMLLERLCGGTGERARGATPHLAHASALGRWIDATTMLLQWTMRVADTHAGTPRDDTSTTSEDS